MINEEKAWKEAEKETARSVIMRLSRYSLALQLGKYRKKEDIDKLRKEVLAYDFRSPKEKQQDAAEAAKNAIVSSGIERH